MKKSYVYEIVNLMGTVEYVGETYRPKYRFKQHTKTKPSNGSGSFYNRADVFMNIVKEFDTKKEAFDYQCRLQKYYGLKTDYDAMKERQIIITKIPRRTAISIVASDLNGNYVGEFSSLREAARELMIKSHQNIKAVLSGKFNQIKGYRFQYK